MQKKLANNHSHLSHPLSSGNSCTFLQLAREVQTHKYTNVQTPITGNSHCCCHYLHFCGHSFRKISFRRNQRITTAQRNSPSFRAASDRHQLPKKTRRSQRTSAKPRPRPTPSQENWTKRNSGRRSDRIRLICMKE